MERNSADIVETLFRARGEGAAVCIPPGFEKRRGLEIQLAVATRFAEAGDPIGGWKVGLTSRRAKDFMGVGFRPFGFVQASRILRSHETIELGAFFNAGIEPELCIILDMALRGPNISPDRVRAATRSVAAAFELADIRVAGGLDADPATLIADGLGGWGVVVGDEVDPEEFRRPVTVTLRRDGEVIARATAGNGLDIDDPFLSVSRLCGQLHEFGIGLEPGQPVITGAFAAAAIDRPGLWSADFTDVGAVAVTFA
jgi:2-keto-4-pentenoate hydratase